MALSGLHVAKEISSHVQPTSPTHKTSKQKTKSEEGDTKEQQTRMDGELQGGGGKKSLQRVGDGRRQRRQF